METHVKYLLFSTILIIVSFLVVPIVFFYQGSGDRHELTPASESVTGDENLEPDNDNNRKCSDYYYPCINSLDSKNHTICIPRSFHCDKEPNCPNGEDEIGCDTAYLLIDLFKSYNASVGFNVSAEEKYQENFYHNCSLFEVIDARCSCNFSHPEKADCKQQRMSKIPPILPPSITSLNLEGNDISHIDEWINRYTRLSVISLRFNHIRRIPDDTFVNLKNLKRLYLRGNEIVEVGPMAFRGLHSLEKLYINDNRLKHLSLAVLRQTPRLNLLDLAENFIYIDREESFPVLPMLDWLDLSYNRLTGISSKLLSQITNLTKLHLQGNWITSIDSDAFSCNQKLTEINLSHNRLSILSPDLMNGLSLLRSLYLEENAAIEELPVQLFQELMSLRLLNLTGIRISNINRFHFHKNQNLTHLSFSRFKYCLFAPQVRICEPSSDGVSSLQHLLVYPILRIAVWIVAFITCVGNFVVFTWRSFSRNEDAVLSLFVKNLSFADMLTGIYLISIGMNDIGFQDEYLVHALDWMSSWKCTAIGFLAMVSAEVSVLILTIVAVERYRSIAFSARLLNMGHARILMSAAWITAGVLAGAPLIISASQRVGGEVGYYGSNGLCFPLHIDDPFANGWRYSAFLFLGVNLCAVLSMLLLYGKMFAILNSDRKSALPGHIDKDHEDMVLAVRFFFIVFTDCMCWLPIVLIKILAFVSPQTVSPTIYAWVVVFILPINSAINPIIYTIAAPTAIRYRIAAGLKKLACPLLLADCRIFGKGSSSGAGGSGGNNSNSGNKRNSSSASTATGIIVLGPSAAANLLMKNGNTGRHSSTAATLEKDRKRSSNGSVMSAVTMSTFRNVSTSSSRRNSSAAAVIVGNICSTPGAATTTTAMTKQAFFAANSLSKPVDDVIMESPVRERQETEDSGFGRMSLSKSEDLMTVIGLDSQVFV